MIALNVRLEEYPKRLADFLAAIAENAKSTFTYEAGCKYFDVAQDVKKPTHFIFYELYEDDAAIAAHKAMPHFSKWREAADVCVVKESQINTFCNQLFHHSKE